VCLVPAMSAASPPPQVVGGSHGSDHDAAAEMQRQMAAAAAAQGARQAASQAKTGINEITAYITENPASVKVMCFVVGLVLMVFSILGCFSLFGAEWKAKEYLNNIYNIFFGLLICICEGRDSWQQACCNVRDKLHAYAFFLATHTGKACFYLYVGTMTILVLPDSTFWSIIYVIIGSVLSLLALWMLFLAWCGKICGCKTGYEDMGPDPPAPASGTPPRSTI